MYKKIKKIFDFALANPDQIKPYHWAIYMVAVEMSNRLRWPSKIGMPTFHVMHISGISHRETYYKGLQDLHDFGMIRIIEKSVNQSTATVISFPTGDESADGQPADSQTISTGHIGRSIKTNDIMTNKDALSEIFKENLDFQSFMLYRGINAEKKINDFLDATFATGENEKWSSPADFFAHFRNYLFKQAAKSTEISIQKAKRR